MLLWVVIAALAPGFVSPFNLFAISRSVGIDIVIGFSTMVVLATGGMNLAIGSIGVCSVMLAGWLMQAHGCACTAGDRSAPAFFLADCLASPVASRSCAQA